jgi:hypothetical protein
MPSLVTLSANLEENHRSIEVAMFLLFLYVFSIYMFTYDSICIHIIDALFSFWFSMIY